MKRQRKPKPTMAGLTRENERLREIIVGERAAHEDTRVKLDKAERELRDIKRDVQAAKADKANAVHQAAVARSQRDRLAGYIEGHRAFTSPNMPNTADDGMYRETWLDRFLAQNTSDLHLSYDNGEPPRMTDLYGPHGLR